MSRIPVTHIFTSTLSAGISGPLTPWFNDPSAPQHKDTETLGRALFDSASYNDWGSLFSINTSSLHFMTTAFLGLLAKGGEDEALYTSSVINVTSLSGNNKLAQNQVWRAHLRLRAFFADLRSLHTTRRKRLRHTSPRCSQPSSRSRRSPYALMRSPRACTSPK